MQPGLIAQAASASKHDDVSQTLPGLLTLLDGGSEVHEAILVQDAGGRSDCAPIPAHPHAQLHQRRELLLALQRCSADVSCPKSGKLPGSSPCPSSERCMLNFSAGKLFILAKHRIIWPG